MNYVEFIEKYCFIKDKTTGEIKPTRLTKAQIRFLNYLSKIKHNE